MPLFVYYRIVNVEHASTSKHISQDACIEICTRTHALQAESRRERNSIGSRHKPLEHLQLKHSCIIVMLRVYFFGETRMSHNNYAAVHHPRIGRFNDEDASCDSSLHSDIPLSI